MSWCKRVFVALCIGEWGARYRGVCGGVNGGHRCGVKGVFIGVGEGEGGGGCGWLLYWFFVGAVTVIVAHLVLVVVVGGGINGAE